MQTVTIKVSGMSCMGCVESIKRLLTALAGVEQVEVDLALGLVKVGYDAARLQLQTIQEAIEAGGYRVVA